jgi:NAD(P)-dependent dehydrogenase (short-subunit alcohol dehydrogenase family)
MTSSGAATRGSQAWGAYGSSKAAMNHLATTLGVEELEVTTIAIRPGLVDTEMQRELREIHHKTMAPEDVKKFADAKSAGKLLSPEQPGHVMARLVLDAPREFSGKFLTFV